MSHARRIATVSIIALALGLMLPAAGHAAEPTPIRVNAFPNAKALPLHAGLAKGIFARRGFAVELHLTENSRSQREGLAAGKFDVVHSAVDNAVAMIEVAKHDVVIVSGGDSGMNEFFVQADIKSFADLRGRIIVVDAPDTAYALQAKKIMLQHGLKDGNYTIKPVGAGVYRFKAMLEDKNNAGGILNLPFTVQAEQAGLKSLGRTIDMLGPYQAAGAFMLRTFADRNKDTVDRYLAAYVEALRFVRDPANRTDSVAILVDKLKLSAKEAERTYELLMDPRFGFTPDAAFDREGFKNMLALRAEIERKPGAAVPPPERYVDLTYYERAMKLVGR
jgi:ABC-type nitrate/sulfonate/bicarbonate transport system substrate-binding protein